jgi:signal transduction histidine kinase
VSRVALFIQRLPIRVKLALISVGVMSIVMVGLGLFLYFRFEDELDTSIDQALSSRAIAAAVLSSRSKSSLITELSREEGFGELVSRDGRVLTATPDVGRRLLIPRNLLRRAANGTVYFELKRVTGVSKHARLIARPVSRGGSIVVAGTTLKDRERANESLVRALLIGVPIALLLATLTAIALIGGALRPVEQMRRRAETISAGEPDARLPLPEAQDEVRRLGDTLNEMLARLQGAFERERSFVADASHELRTPLAILSAELELASRGDRSNAELHAAINSAAEEVDRLTRLAEDLLVLARADNCGVPVRPETQSVEPLVREVAAAFAQRADGRDIEVDVAGVVEAPVDAERIRQALGNLVDNALAHGEGGVRLSARHVNGSVELHVQDHGPGFPDHFIARAFERFTRADPARARGGAGLGLAIADAIARGHGGRAHARNTGEGSDVWLELPLQASSSRRANGSASQSPPNSTSADTPATTAAASE